MSGGPDRAPLSNCHAVVSRLPGLLGTPGINVE